MNAQPQFTMDNREYHFRTLIDTESQNHNQYWFAKILASWMSGESTLPDYLGLAPVQFELMTHSYFPQIKIPHLAQSGIQLDASRMLEKDDLINLLQQFCVKPSAEAEWIINLFVSACLGNDHLWQDMGFWQRSDLSEFLAFNFPELAQRNSKDMKWKKFLYKQLCEAEGIYLCRAPSCEVCKDYSECFGSEE